MSDGDHDEYDFDAMGMLLDKTVGSDTSDDDDDNDDGDPASDEDQGPIGVTYSENINHSTKVEDRNDSSATKITTPERGKGTEKDDDRADDNARGTGEESSKDSTLSSKPDDWRSLLVMAPIDSKEENTATRPAPSGRSYNVVALISGGKDSIFNCMHCVSRGHKLLALANIAPSPDLHALDEKKDISSFMYQTVGHEMIDAIAECMELPLVRRRTKCKAKTEALEYAKVEGDEVEDMFVLLQEVKRKFPTVDAVAVGAVFSNYQRNRVENVCARLGLIPLCFLWRRNQRRLLKDMVDCSVEAVLVKVACLGLDETDVGKTIAQMETKLLDLNAKFDVHPCGEGGEYETLTLDCPLFVNRRIVLDATHVIKHSDDGVAPVVSLAVDKFHVEVKDKESASDTLIPRDDFLQIGVSIADDHVRDALLSLSSIPSVTNGSTFCFATKAILNDASSTTISRRRASSSESSESMTTADLECGFIHVACFGVTKASSDDGCASSSAGTVREETARLMCELTSRLSAYGASLADVLHARLYLQSMSDFAEVNKSFCAAFADATANLVPARSCVEIPTISKHRRVRISCIARVGSGTRKKGEPTRRRTLWVRSISSWAPTNIGPYCQANTSVRVGSGSGSVSLLAGQIGLDPSTMTLVKGGWGSELVQTVANCQAVLSAVYENVGSYAVMHAVLFVAWDRCELVGNIESRHLQRSQIARAMRELCTAAFRRHQSDDSKESAQVLVVAVPALPRRATVELEIVAADRCRSFSRVHENDVVVFGSYVERSTLVAHAALTGLTDNLDSSVDMSILRGALLPAVLATLRLARIHPETSALHVTVYYVSPNRSTSFDAAEDSLSAIDLALSHIVNTYMLDASSFAQMTTSSVPVAGLEGNMPVSVQFFASDHGGHESPGRDAAEKCRAVSAGSKRGGEGGLWGVPLCV